MRTQYIENPDVTGNILHNGKFWQVTEFMGGLCCELLLKTRVISLGDQRELKAADHACYPSVLFQGEVSDAFLADLGNAQKKLTPAEMNTHFFNAYHGIVRCPAH